MTIEFHCGACHARLRTTDDKAGMLGLRQVRSGNDEGTALAFVGIAAGSVGLVFAGVALAVMFFQNA
ncbi:MAG: hypothetical protein ACE5KM_07005 [Planctomycetaceae bacterium]